MVVMGGTVPSASAKVNSRTPTFYSIGPLRLRPWRTRRFATRSRRRAWRRSRSISPRPATHSRTNYRRAARCARRRARQSQGSLRGTGLDPREGLLERGEPGGLRGRRAARPKHFGSERFPQLFRELGELGKPSICAAGGHVLAGALGLALACDLVIAREGVRFGTPEINVGAFPFMIMALIYRNVPRKKVNELMLAGRADLGRGGAADRDRQPRGARGGVRGGGRVSGRRSSRRNRR